MTTGFAILRSSRNNLLARIFGKFLIILASLIFFNRFFSREAAFLMAFDFGKPLLPLLRLSLNLGRLLAPISNTVGELLCDVFEPTDAMLRRT